MTAFFDTNILLYAVSNDPLSARANAIPRNGGRISVQVLNEFANVSRKKMGRQWDDIADTIETFRELLGPILPVTDEIHRAALTLARDHQLAFYDAVIVATAAHTGCTVVYSQDMQHSRKFGALSVINPFP